MSIFRVIAGPANLAGDLLQIENENERAVARMLVNAPLWTTLHVIVILLVV